LGDFKDPNVSKITTEVSFSLKLSFRAGPLAYFMPTTTTAEGTFFFASPLVQLRNYVISSCSLSMITGDCIKVAIDLISPVNVAHCEKLMQEFRLQNKHDGWKEDVLQLKSSLWYAWRSCSVLEKCQVEFTWQLVMDMVLTLTGSSSSLRLDAIGGFMMG